jgi:hypothetical protein
MAIFIEFNRTKNSLFTTVLNSEVVWLLCFGYITITLAEIYGGLFEACAFIVNIFHAFV